MAETKKEKMEFETFREIGNYERGNLMQKEPSCFNSSVRVRKYRVTVELVDEPKEVIEQRLVDLWEVCDNHHHWTPLRNAAAKAGVTLLTETCGIRNKK